MVADMLACRFICGGCRIFGSLILCWPVWVYTFEGRLQQAKLILFPTVGSLYNPIAGYGFSRCAYGRKGFAEPLSYVFPRVGIFMYSLSENWRIVLEGIIST